MNPYEIFTKNEIDLVAGVTKIENREYTKEEAKLIRGNIFDEIFLKSFKNGDMDKARIEFTGIIEKLDRSII